jgi:hypothetical protein
LARSHTADPEQIIVMDEVLEVTPKLGRGICKVAEPDGFLNPAAAEPFQFIP